MARRRRSRMCLWAVAAWVLAVGELALPAELAPQGVYLASREPDGTVRIVIEAAVGGSSVHVPVVTELEGAEWRPFGLRGLSSESGAARRGVREVSSELPSIHVRSDFQLISFSGIVNARAGVAAIGSWGVRVLLSGIDGRYRPLEGGAVLAPDERHIGLAVRGERTEEIFLLDVSGSAPSVRPVSLPADAARVEPRSVTLTSSAIFFAALLEGNLWVVCRAPTEASGGPEEALVAESICAPMREAGMYMASSETAVAFLAGDDKDSWDVFVGGSSGPAVNVTRSPGAILEHSPETQRLAISSDGDVVAYGRRVAGEPETFIHDVAIPGPAGEEHLTSDERFNPYIDQESLIFFDGSGRLILAAGHDPVSTDVFSVSSTDPSQTVNLTQTGGGPDPPFLTKGTLAVQNAISTEQGMLLVSATGFPGVETSGVLAVSLATGQTLFRSAGLADPDASFSVGSDTYVTRTLPDGGHALFLLRGEVIVEVGRAPAGPRPQLLSLSASFALFCLPGTGLLALEGGTEPRLLVASSEIAPSAAVDLSGGFVVFGRPVAGAGYRYFLLDTRTGTESAISADPISGQVLAFADLPGLFLRGDFDSDGGVNISDAVLSLLYLFVGSDSPPCADAADANDDGVLTVTDPIFTLRFLFQGGAAPPPPTAEPGLDPTPDSLECARTPS